MKEYIKPLVPTILLITCSILLNSCIKHDGCEETNDYKEYSISQNTLDQIPYRKDGLDTLVYISRDGDTAILYGVGVKKRYVSNREDENGNPDCNNYTNYKTQVIDYTYKGAQPEFNQLTFYLYYYVSSKYDIYEVANFSSTSYYRIAFLESTIGSGDYPTNLISLEENFNDSIVVNNMTIYGARMHSKTGEIVAVYNKIYGVIKVETEGKTWIKKL